MKKIKIPRVDKDKFHELVIQRGLLGETRKAVGVKLQKQDIAGMTIPQGFEIWIPGCVANIKAPFSSRPIFPTPGWVVNKILAKLYMDQLRNV